MTLVDYLIEMNREEFLPMNKNGSVDFSLLKGKLYTYGQFGQVEIVTEWIRRFDECGKQEAICRPFDETVDALAPYDREYIEHFSQLEGWIHADSEEDLWRKLNDGGGAVFWDEF